MYLFVVISDGRVQRVFAGPLDVGLRGFGFSISGNADVDHNLYPGKNLYL